MLFVAFTTHLFRTGQCTYVNNLRCEGLLTLVRADCLGRGKAVVVLLRVRSAVASMPCILFPEN